MATVAQQDAEILALLPGPVALMAARDHLLAVAGGLKRSLNKSVSKQIEEKINSPESIVASRGERTFISVAEDGADEYQHEAITPILCEGDVIGAVILVEGESKTKMGEVEQKLILAAAGFLGRQMEQ